MQSTLTFTLAEVPRVARLLAQLLQDQVDILTLTGSLGSGKTTLVQALLAAYGIQEQVVSPTFTYLQVYKSAGITIYHFDLYRLASAAAFVQAGFDEYLYQPNSKAIIEWPELIAPLLTHRVCHAALSYTHDPLVRTLTWQVIP